MFGLEVVDVVTVGLTPERWAVAELAFGVVLFTCGFLISERW